MENNNKWDQTLFIYLYLNKLFQPRRALEDPIQHCAETDTTGETYLFM